MLCRMARPTVPIRRLAPTTATEAGWNTCRRLATSAWRSRAADAVQVGIPARVRVIARQLAGEFDHAVGQLAPGAQPGVPEDLLHFRVLREDGGGEDGDAAVAGVGHQVLQQQRADTAAVHVVGHRDGDLRLVPVVLDLVAGHADDLAAAHGEQRRVVRGGRPADPRGLLLRGKRAGVEEPQVGVVGRHGLVHGLDRLRVIRAGRPDLDCRPVGKQRVDAGPGGHGGDAHRCLQRAAGRAGRSEQRA